MKSPQAVVEQIERATRPEDLFGPATDDGKAQRTARRLFRTYLIQVHSDRAASTGLDPTRATDVLLCLRTLYRDWQQACPGAPKPASGNASHPITLTTLTGTYVLGGVVGEGTVCNLYAAVSSDGPVTVKMPRRPQSSRFVENERTALAALAQIATGGFAWLAPYFPVLLESGTHRATGANEQRKVNVLNALGAEQGFVSLAQVRRAYPTGLDGRDRAWMYRRLLRALAGAQLAGLVHGAVLAENVLIHPKEHGLVLAGWSFATTEGKTLPGMVASADSYPPEATEMGTVTHKTDVYMAARLMRSILRPEERRQRAFAQGCTQITPGMRPDAAGLLDEYDNLLSDLYGPRRFRPFHLPATLAGNN